MQNPFKIYDVKSTPRISPNLENDFVDEEEIFSDAENKGFFGRAISSSRIRGWLFFLAMVVFVMFFKVGYLQIVRGAYYSDMAEGNRIRILEIKAERGLIFDRNNKLLVANDRNFMLGVIPVDLPKEPDSREELIKKITEILQFDESLIREKISNIRQYSYETEIIKDNLSYEQAVLTKIAAASYPGLVLALGSSRNYLESGSSPSLSHILGYLGKINEQDFEKYPNSDYSLTDSLGRVGLELGYEQILAGKKGKAKIEVDAHGRQTEILANTPEHAGNDLVLTLDLEMQKKMEEILSRHLQLNKLSRGVAIVENPNNGEILALVSLPTFNNNDFTFGISEENYKKLSEDENKPLFNRAVTGTYPSGSTIKPILAAAALQEGLITPWTTFLSTGGIWVSDRWFFPDWKAGGHGLTNVYKAIAESVNTFFYIIGGGYENIDGLEMDRITEYYNLAGVGRKLGIDLPGESPGLLPTEQWKEQTKGEDWYIGDTYHLSIGQGDILVTPLQVASWTALVANDGTLYRPHIVKTIINTEENKRQEIGTEVLESNFFNSDNLEVVRQGMRKVITDGSGVRLYDLPVAVAGKTGTAEWSTKNKPHAWFTGFAPYLSPEIVITVLVEEGGEGSAVAVPIAKEFFAWWGSNVDNSY